VVPIPLPVATFKRICKDQAFRQSLICKAKDGQCGTHQGVSDCDVASQLPLERHVKGHIIVNVPMPTWRTANAMLLRAGQNRGTVVPDPARKSNDTR
jgi:hypothetical protein